MRKTWSKIPLSILDLAPISEGYTAKDAFRNSLELAQSAEKWGYHRYWIAEHHNMPGIASSATSVLIGYLAAGTDSIRLGSGGIMLPNHAPLLIAEQFGTLESMYPGRIDLGLGRAPGSDQKTAKALRRDMNAGLDFPHQLEELRTFFNPSRTTEENPVQAVPGRGLDIPIWLLGSSDFTARLAGQLGLPYAFASHFAPQFTVPAIQLYRDSFCPSETLKEPYCMVGVNVITAETDEKAMRLSTSMQQSFLSLIRNKPELLQPPVDNIAMQCSSHELDAIERQLGSSVIGSPATVDYNLQSFLDQTNADELIINAAIYDHEDRMKSYKLLAQMMHN